MSYHEGELAMQKRAGVVDLAARVGRIIGDEIPAAAAAFLAAQQFVLVATAGRGGDVTASVAGGPAGFAHASDPATVILQPEWGNLAIVDDDIAATGIAGLLAIDFAARRRIRVNGYARRDGARIIIDTREVYSNCPQYILPRRSRTLPAGAGEMRRGAFLDDEQQHLIAAAQTFFIASTHPDRGADMSHRGGPEGFITVQSTTLVWPDYEGNNMFNTLGNLLVSPRCGLLFIDFMNGRTLQLHGRATVTGNDERRVLFDLDEVIDTAGAMRLRFD